MAEDATLPAAPTPLSPNYVPTSPDYTSDSDSDSKTFKEDPQEAYPDESSEEDPLVDDLSNEDTIEAGGPLQAHEITARPCKRYRSPPSSSSTLSSPSPSPLPSRKRCRSPSLPPPPPLPPALLLPCKRFRMTLSHQETNNETTIEAIIPSRLHKKSQALTGEPIHHSIPLLAARLVRHENQIEEIQGHLKEILVESIKSVEHEIETVRERVEAAEQQIEVLHESLGITRDMIVKSQIRIEDAKAHLHESEFKETGLRARLRRLED
uniref:Uncharacterized protein n=1 Tax=Tanacetum cinerariifolium TaxID=118510 RepID=A0A699GWU8_TANCI|nr:hypothetical protein [Tanacetum cinerariifolium]